MIIIVDSQESGMPRRHAGCLGTGLGGHPKRPYGVGPGEKGLPPGNKPGQSCFSHLSASLVSLSSTPGTLATMEKEP